MKKFLSLVTVVVLSVSMLAGCGSKERTLESYANSNAEFMAQMENFESSASQDGIKASVNIKGNVMTFVMTCSSEVESQLSLAKDMVAQIFDQSFSGLAEQLGTSITAGEWAEMGINGFTLKFEIKGESGAEIYTNSFEVTK